MNKRELCCVAKAPFQVFVNREFVNCSGYLKCPKIMPNPNKPDPNLVKVSPPTLFAIAVAAILIPLLLVGFISQ